MLNSWNELHKEGKIKSLNIKYYRFDPTFHFMILNGRLVHFGLFQPKHINPGPEILTSYIVNEDTNSGMQLVNDFKIIFETMWNEFGHKG